MFAATFYGQRLQTSRDILHFDDDIWDFSGLILASSISA